MRKITESEVTEVIETGFQLLNAFRQNSLQRCHTVSYTHLDVYKRQAEKTGTASWKIREGTANPGYGKSLELQK